ncbi:D-aspartate oxidase [Parasteatoda tepidariorum]|uniref:D-aspartate oxidase n=1 Tax=Parasteatoda tepidariorum TaxID=114398 RepID=UPI00077F83C7|nr:D-amino-acid oxidase [Parasteatoda tepidariorum]
MAPIRKVAVIGAGIVGSSSALIAIEKVPNIEVTLISETFSPFTTGDGSAGLWKPYLLGNVAPERLRFWLTKTFNFLQDIFMSENASECGVGLLPCYEISTTPLETPTFKDIFLDWRPMNLKEMALFPSRYKYGAFMTTYFAECTKLIPELLKKFKERGGQIIKQKVENFSELCGKYDVVINCSGIGATGLTHDPELKPIRGQVIRVKAPWIKYAVMDPEFYILPNAEETICGGTKQVGDWNLDIVPKDRERILSGCTDLYPSLKKAQVVREWVGLRPGRNEPRIERETIKTVKGTIEVIHNYGHGGSGVTIGWGCAHEAITLLEDALNDINLNNIRSNL